MKSNKTKSAMTALVIAAMLCSAAMPIRAAEAQWVNNNGTWSYVKEDGSIAKGWIKDNNCWYAFDDNGAMRTGWIASNEHWYFMGESGVMQADAWVEDNGARYYIKGTGVMAKDYVKDGYELTEDGKAIPLAESKSVVLTAPEALEGEVIEGNLYVDVTTAKALELKGVTVKGKLVVIGDNKTAGKLTITDSKIEAISTQTRNTEVVLSGETEVKTIVLEETAAVTPDKNFKGEVEKIEVQSTTKGEVVIEVPAQEVSTRTYASVDIQAPVESLEVKTDTQIKVNADVKNVVVTESAKDTAIEVSKGSTVGTLTADAPVSIDGKGTINKVEANVDGVEAGKDTVIKDVETGKDVEKAPEVNKPSTGGSTGGSSSGGGTTKPTVETTPAPVKVRRDGPNDKAPTESGFGGKENFQYADAYKAAGAVIQTVDGKATITLPDAFDEDNVKALKELFGDKNLGADENTLYAGLEIAIPAGATQVKSSKNLDDLGNAVAIDNTNSYGNCLMQYVGIATTSNGAYQPVKESSAVKYYQFLDKDNKVLETYKLTIEMVRANPISKTSVTKLFEDTEYAMATADLGIVSYTRNGNTIKASGDVNYITGWSAYSGDDANGYYIVFDIDVTGFETKAVSKMTLLNGDVKELKNTDANQNSTHTWIVRLRGENVPVVISVDFEGNGNFIEYTIDTSDLTLKEPVTFTANNNFEWQGKKLEDIQSDVEVTNDKITGTLNYVSGWDDGAWGEEMNEGYYIVFDINVPNNKTITKRGEKTNTGDTTHTWVIYLGKNEAEVKAKSSLEIIVDMDGDMEKTSNDTFKYNLDLSGLDLTPKPETIPNESPAE